MSAIKEVEDYIYHFEGNQREVLFFFHDLFTKGLNLTEKIRFKIPFYYGRSWICFLNPVKGGKIEVAFIRGNELSNDQGLLESKGRKQVYGIEFEKVSEIPLQLMNEIIHEAILLDQSTPYSFKRKPK